MRLSIITFLMINLMAGGINAQKGCSAPCTIDAITEDKAITHYIFTGDDTTGLDVKLTKIVIVEGKKQLVKRRDPNCLSSNPVECLKDVYEEIPPVTMNLYTLPDNTKTDQYETRLEIVKVVKRAGGTTDEPIVCIKNRTKSLVSKIQKALIEKGYPLKANGILDQATNLSIVDFQRNASLPYGELSLATVAALGIE
jgi:hypothetical protein